MRVVAGLVAAAAVLVRGQTLELTCNASAAVVDVSTPDPGHLVNAAGVVAATVNPGNADFAAGVGGRSAACRPFPAGLGTYCSVLLGGSGEYYMPNARAAPGSDEWRDFYATEAVIKSKLAGLQQAQSMVSQRCFKTFQLYSCVARYPACSSAGEPLKLALDVCQFVASGGEGCQLIVDGARVYTHDLVLPVCNAATVVTPAWPGYFFKPDAWLGSQVWAGGAEPGLTLAQLEATNSSAPDALELTCVFPQVPTVGRGSEANRTSCEWPCEHPLYSSSEWLVMRLALVVPALLSVPLNVAALWKASTGARLRLLRGRRAGAGEVNWLFIAAICAAIAFALIIALPAAALGNEVGCVSMSQPVIHESAVCWVSKTAPFVLQVFLNCVTVTLWRVLVRVVAAKSMRQVGKSSRSHIAVTVALAFGLPLCLGITALALNNNSLQKASGAIEPVQYAFLVRNGFLCLPRINDIALELALIHIPLLAAGLTALAFALAVALVLGDYQPRAFLRVLFCSADRLLERIGLGDSEPGTGSASHMAGPASLTSRLSSQMMRFAGVMFVFLSLSTAAVLLFFPKLKAFEDSLYVWSDCNQNNGLLSCLGRLASAGYDPRNADNCCRACNDGAFAISNMDVCGTCSDTPNATTLFSSETRAENQFPAVWVLTLFYLAWGCLPFFFGLFFAMGALRGCLRTAVRSAVAVGSASRERGVTSRVTRTAADDDSLVVSNAMHGGDAGDDKPVLPAWRNARAPAEQPAASSESV